MEYAETVLRHADSALHAGTEPIKVETAMVRGSPGSTSIGESRNAAMVCAGSAGIGRCSRLLLGSTATALARGAHCVIGEINTDSMARIVGSSAPDEPDQAGCSVLVVRD